MSVEEINALIATQVIAGLSTAVYAPIAEPEQFLINVVSADGIGQHINVLRRANDLVWRERESADQRETDAEAIERADELFSLPAQARQCSHVGQSPFVAYIWCKA
jgi:hypothetical protein